LGTTENLKDSGFSESQAKAITETVPEAQQQNLDVLITKGDSENGVENLEVCLSGFLLIRSRTSFAGMTFLRNYSHYIVIPGEAKRRPGIQECFYKVGLQTTFDSEFG
tara:strand:- start:167 stop:490 length:324 start_codon:yes stop_codon:yes gene_type:complete